MNPFDRALFLLFALAGMLTAALCAVYAVGWQVPVAFIKSTYEVPGFRETVYALAAVYFLVGARLAWISVRREKRHAVVQEGDLGQVRIALNAIESLAEKVALDQRGLREARATVEAVKQGIGIQIRAVVAPDVSIPEVSAHLQELIREKVREVTGIEISAVKIMVANISAQKLRVE
ncbi:MAG: alkaline shock response membrane anchor protein AmaP [Bacillota bacterium]